MLVLRIQPLEMARIRGKAPSYYQVPRKGENNEGFRLWEGGQIDATCTQAQNNIIETYPVSTIEWRKLSLPIQMRNAIKTDV